VTDIYLIKRHGILMPSSESDEEIILSLANGETIKCAFSKPRNAQFHRLYFALLDVLYNIFDPEVPEDKWYNGVKPVKNRTRFRKDIAIATGYYELVVNVKGEVRAEAKSISFASMDDLEFSQLYSNTIDYGLAKIAVGYDRKQIDNWVAQIMDFT
jgi:hypothetical protein